MRSNADSYRDQTEMWWVSESHRIATSYKLIPAVSFINSLAQY